MLAAETTSQAALLDCLLPLVRPCSLSRHLLAGRLPVWLEAYYSLLYNDCGHPHGLEFCCAFAL